MLGNSNETKIAVLEERLSAFEIMMKKIDEAIQIMGKTSQSISKMLAVHEEKLENSHKNDDIIIEKMKEIEEKNTEDHKKVIKKLEEFQEKIDERIEDIEEKVESITKFRWILIGAATIIAFLVSAPHIVTNILTSDQEPSKIERVK